MSTIQREEFQWFYLFLGICLLIILLYFSLVMVIILFNPLHLFPSPTYPLPSANHHFVLYS